MANEVNICNLALSHIGVFSKIQSLSESTKEARECNLLYATARNAVLEDLDWNFARKQMYLALLDETYTGWAYAYQYPTDCIIARKIFNEGEVDSNTAGWDTDNKDNILDKVEFEIRASSNLDRRIILTNQEDAILLYTAKVTDVNMFSSQFIDALAWRLAAELAVPLRNKADLYKEMINHYLMKIIQVKAHNANEGHKGPEDINTFVRARG